MALSLPRLAWAARDLVDRVARRSPARLAVALFVGIIAIVAALLATPWATTSGHRAPLVDAIFTAVSAVCVTGLTTVQTGLYWSFLGKLVILVAIKIGGLGIMTLASLVGLAFSRRLGLTQRMLTASETRETRLGEVGSLVRIVIVSSTSIELIMAAIIGGRLLYLGQSVGQAAWHGIFYAISSFNNAGFVPTGEGLEPYAADWFVCVPIAVGVFLGSLGFPVIMNVLRHWRRHAPWSLHTKLTMTTTVLVALAGMVLLGIMEWNNPATLGAHNVPTKILGSFFAGIMPRSGGLSTVPTAEMHQSSWLVQDAMMFVGGGSASTAGGIKVTTLAVMMLAIRAEARGDRDVEAFGRRIPPATLRVAVAVSFIGATMVLVVSLILLGMTGLSFDKVVFETLSAFGTCGLSVGVSEALPPAGKYVMVALMFAGRVGTMTLAAALALRDRRRVIRLPQEQPIIG